jgi:hypothetical protein
MHRAIHDQASGLRVLMNLSQPMDVKISTKLRDLISELDGLGLAGLQKKLNAINIPVIKLLNNHVQKAPLDILNASEIVLHINQSSESIKSAYGIVKLLSKSPEERELGLLIEASSETKSKTIFHNIKMAGNAFQHIHLTYLGCLVSGNTYINAHNSDI